MFKVIDLFAFALPYSTISPSASLTTRRTLIMLTIMRLVARYIFRLLSISTLR